MRKLVMILAAVAVLGLGVAAHAKLPRGGYWVHEDVKQLSSSVQVYSRTIYAPDGYGGESAEAYVKFTVNDNVIGSVHLHDVSPRATGLRFSGPDGSFVWVNEVLLHAWGVDQPGYIAAWISGKDPGADGKQFSFSGNVSKWDAPDTSE